MRVVSPRPTAVKNRRALIVMTEHVRPHTPSLVLWLAKHLHKVLLTDALSEGFRVAQQRVPDGG